MWRSLLLSFLSCAASLQAAFTSLHTTSPSKKELEHNSLQWKVESLSPFDELLLSWDASRPDRGNLTFLVRVKTDSWSPWMRYSEWGRDTQLSFNESHPDSFVKLFQDTLNTQQGKTANAFEIKVIGKQGASLEGLRRLFVCTSQISRFAASAPEQLEQVLLSVPGQSQMILDHPRSKDMCSPTSTSTVVNFLLGKKEVQPLDFASHVKDMGFDIYGNWALNVAEANHVLKGKFSCHIERLESFADLHSYLKKGLPVVVSVKGDIPGAVKPYQSGHLMVVTGFDPENKRVYCVDSAFDANEKTAVNYALEDFLKAWGTRKNLAYVFLPSD